MLFELARENIDKVIDKLQFSFMNVILKFPKYKNYVQSLLHNEYQFYNLLELELESKYFRVFLNEPQISDILKDYLVLLAKCNITGFELKRKLYKDDIVNYFIRIIENHFLNLSDERSILAIRKYINSLIKIITFDLQDNLYNDLTERENGHVLGFVNKEYFAEDIDRILTAIKCHFVPQDSKFENLKKSYAKALKQYYKNGFIYLLGEYEFNEFYIPPVLKKRTRLTKKILHKSKIEWESNRDDWKNIFDSNHIIYLVGGAGYGKSLFLRNIINNYSALDIENSEEHLLIYCDLKTYFNGDRRKKTITEFFQESMISIVGMEGISKEFINYYLNKGRCIILLDALDEVPKFQREDLHNTIMAFFASCNSHNKVCITSRDRGFFPRNDIEVMEIIPLKENDIDDYIEKMIELKKFKSGDKHTFMKQAKTLIEKDFLNNFLVLSLLVNIYKSEQELPENKIDLYKKCFEYIAKKREEEKSKTGYNWNLIYPLMKDSTFIKLSTLAVPNNTDIRRENVEELLLKMYKTKYSDEAETECAIKEFLDFCSNRTELFVPASTDDNFKFFHRSFFEYFYSRYIHQQSDIKEMYDLMAKFDVDSEVFELTVALVKEDNEEKYQELINYILEKVNEEFNESKPSGTAFGILTLAMQVIDDAYYINKYYEIIIHYSSIISGDEISDLNQKLMSMWIDKEISINDEKKEEFLKTYSADCISFLCLLFSKIKKSEFHDVHTTIRWTIVHDDEYDEVFDIVNNIDSFPFYILLFNKYANLYEMMEECINKGFASISIGGEKKSVLRSGFNNYQQLSQEDRKLYFKYLKGKK